MFKICKKFSKRKEGEIMSGYMIKYVGKFRVNADIDLATNDFVRIKRGESKGKLDPSFDDFYIKCKGGGKNYDTGGKIRHFQSNILLYYCPSTARFKNILKKIYQDKIGDIEKFKNTSVNKKGKESIIFNYENMYQELFDNKILLFIEELDFEGEFRFKSNMMEYIAATVEAKTLGANISPFSNKNLPSKKTPLKKYDIPLEELTLYKEIIQVLDKNERLVVGKIQNKFDDVIKAKKGKAYDIKFERKLSCLGGKEFIHSIGLFGTYIDFLKQGIQTYQKEKTEALKAK